MIVYTGAGTVCVPVPPSLNNLYPTVNGRRVLSSKYAKWLKIAIPLLRTLAKIERYPVTAELVIEDTIRANRDIDNIIKPILDACVKAEVLDRDDRRSVTKVSVEYRPHDLGQGVLVSFR